MTVEAEEICFSNLVEAAARPFRHEADNRSLSFEVELDPDLGRSIITDSKRLQQVLKNLLSNAFKFTEQGGVRLNVSAAAGGWSAGPPGAQPGGRGRVRGVGHGHRHSAREAADHFRGVPAGRRLAPAASTAAPASASRSAANSRACSAAKSSCAATPGEGSTFTLYLPLRYVGPSARRARRSRSARHWPQSNEYAAAGRARGRAGAGRPARDRAGRQHPADRRGRSALRAHRRGPGARRGFKVLVAMRGAEALELAKQFQPTAISLDVFLPDMLGWTVLSQLKQNPLTRHIPVQMVTLDEDRQHGSRAALSRSSPSRPRPRASRPRSRAIKEFAKPRRKRLLVVEDDPAEQMSIRELLGTTTSRSTPPGPAREALDSLREQQCDCVVLDLRLPDMSGFDVLEQIKRDDSLADVPVVVFTGRELSAEEDAQLHTMARSIVVKGVESPERLLDETALFLHRVVTDLPPEKQRMLERLNSSDEDLVGRTVLLVDDDARNIFALSSVLERRGMHVLTATTGREAIDMVRDRRPTSRSCSWTS